MKKKEAIELCESLTLLTGVYFNLIEEKSGKYLREPYIAKCHLRGDICKTQPINSDGMITCPGGYYFLSEQIKDKTNPTGFFLGAGPFLSADYGSIKSYGTHQEERVSYSVPILNTEQVAALKLILFHFSSCFSNIVFSPEYSMEQIPLSCESNQTQLVRRLKIYVYEHLSEKLTLRETARKLFLSEPYLCRILKKDLGFTFKEYVNIVRIEQSKIYLKQHKYNISETAILCGFSDHNYFSRMFKKLEGISPSEYMKAHND